MLLVGALALVFVVGTPLVAIIERRVLVCRGVLRSRNLLKLFHAFSGLFV